VSKSTVNNIWRAHNLQPHRIETLKLSRDPKFLEKMTDVVGLYLNPATAKSRVSGRCPLASHHGQLRDAQAREGKAVAETQSPFVWTPTVESIQEKLTRSRRTLEQIKPGCTSPN
jgi:hypothetical protein